MSIKRYGCLVFALLIALLVPGPSFAESSRLSDEDIRLTYVLTYNSKDELVTYQEYDSSEHLIYQYDASSKYYFYETFYLYDRETGHLMREKKTHIKYHQGREYPFNDHQIKYKYDEQGRMIESIIESNEGYGTRTHQYQYDENGNVITDIESDGDDYNSTDYTYDEQNRLVKIEEKDSNGIPIETTEIVYSEEGMAKFKETKRINNKYEYTDSFNEKWIYDEKGRLISSVERNYSPFEPGVNYTDYFYNDQDQLIRTELYRNKDRPAPQYDPFVTEYTYTADGRLESETDEQGKTIVYLYTLKMFGDVFADDYFAMPVKWAVEKGITKGTLEAGDFSNAEFSPSDTCTRGQAVTFLWRACGCEKVTDVENPFTDVKASDYYYDAVLWAYKNKITTGTTATTFGPNETCNRGQIVTFLWRSQGEPKSDASIDFTDVASDAYYYAPVRWAVEKGITKGTADKTFSPNDSCTRGQIVTFLYRAKDVNSSGNENGDILLPEI